ncbi:MAG: hypothetical protein ABI229_08025 [Gemmatimonadaceae bacterium]
MTIVEESWLRFISFTRTLEVHVAFSASGGDHPATIRGPMPVSGDGALKPG